MKLMTAAAACALALAVLVNGETSAEPIALDVRVDNVRPDQGAIRIAMYAEGAWLSGEPSAALETAASGSSVTLRLEAPAAGRYGLAAYQDINGDGQLNRNAVGIPSEPYAFSNDAPIQFGPPAFAAAALELSAPTQAVITLR
jgi:uncharacterized protein (DUF2141 family)